MGCGELFLKSGSSTFVGYFLIISIAFIVYGLTSTYVLLIATSEQTLQEELIAIPSLFLACFGILLFISILLGCCAVCKEIPCCLETYTVLLILLASVHLAIGIFTLIHFSSDDALLYEKINEDITQAYLKYPDNPDVLDTIQQWLGCCGITGPFNWIKNDKSIPGSCCKNPLKNCTMISDEIFQEGCTQMVLGFISNTNYIIAWSCIIVGITEVIASMFALVLSCAYWRNSRIMWI